MTLVSAQYAIMGDLSDGEIATNETLAGLSRIEVKEDEAEAFSFDLDAESSLHEKLLSLADEISKDVFIVPSPPKRLPDICESMLDSPRDEPTSELSSVVEVETLDSQTGDMLEKKSQDGHSLLSETVTPATQDVSYVDDSCQAFFLQAAFELLEKNARFEAQILEDIGKTYPELPASNEVIMSGHLKLKKAKETQFGHWKTRFVVISAGKLSYVCNPDSDSTAAHQITKMFIAKGEGKKKIIKGFELPLGTYCKVVEKRKEKSGKFLFRIFSPKLTRGGDSTESALWSANSREERQQWMTAIHLAARPELQSHSFGKGSDPLQERCEKICKAIHTAKSEEEYLRLLSETIGATWVIEQFGNDPAVQDRSAARSEVINVPVEWVQSKLQRRRGEGDNDILQVFRDLQRDRISINGEVFLGASYERGNSSGGDFAGPAICAIISALAQVVRENTSEPTCLTSAQALAFSREILLACNRTQSGGNTYEAVNLLCGNKNYVVIIPESNQATPLKITISKEKSQPPDGIELISRKPADYRCKSEKGSKAKGSRRGSKSDSDFEPIPSVSVYAGSNRANRSSSSPPSPLQHRGAKIDTPMSTNAEITPGAHRRTLSEPFGPLQDQLPIKDTRTESVHEMVGGGPNVQVEVDMQYKILLLNTVDDHESVIAQVRTVFRRSFACAGQRAVALGQGTVALTLRPSHG